MGDAPGDITMNGSGTLHLTGAATYSVPLTLSSGYLSFEQDGSNVGNYASTISGGGSGWVSKSGSGTIILSGANSYTCWTRLYNGVVQADVGAGLPSQSSLILNGGVFQSNSTTTYTDKFRNETSGTNRWLSWWDGGFAGGAGTLTVNLRGNGSAVDWTGNGDTGIGNSMKFGSPTAQNPVVFQNAMNLNGAVRAIYVDDNPNSANDYAIMSGVIANGSGAPSGLVKNGPGLLVLTGVQHLRRRSRLRRRRDANQSGRAAGRLGRGLLVQQRADPQRRRPAKQQRRHVYQSILVRRLERQRHLVQRRFLRRRRQNDRQSLRRRPSHQLERRRPRRHRGNHDLVLHFRPVRNRSPKRHQSLRRRPHDSSGRQSRSPAGDFATISGAISNGGIVKTGAGTLVLTGANSYTSGTTVSGGTLVLRDQTNASFLAAPIANSATLEFNTNNVDMTYTGVISGTGAVNKTGPGRLILTGASTYGDPTGYVAFTTVNEGVLQADRGVGLPINSGLVLNGGVFQSNSAVTFTDPFWMWAPNGKEIIWNDGGFSAGGGKMTVNLFGDGRTINWGTDGHVGIAGTMKFGSSSAQYETELQNGIDLTGVVRTIQVDDNPNSAGDFARISGVISDPNGAGVGGIVKTGPGRLVLSGANTYGDGVGWTGFTTVNEGVLQADRGVGLPAGSCLVLNGGVFQSNSATTFNTGFWYDWGFLIWNNGGFSAGGGKLTVNLYGDGRTLTWGTDGNTSLAGTMILGSDSAQYETEIQNGINLNGAARTVQVERQSQFGRRFRHDFRRHQRLRRRRELDEDGTGHVGPGRRIGQHLHRRRQSRPGKPGLGENVGIAAGTQISATRGR